MKQLDEIIFDAISSDADIMQSVGGRIVSTCFEVAPEESDKTELPCIIVTDDGFTNSPETKDSTWEGLEDHVQSSVEVDGRSPKEVRNLLCMCRAAVARHIRSMADDGEEIPYLVSIQSAGVAWDWLKPCYHSTFTYTCITERPWMIH